MISITDEAGLDSVLHACKFPCNDVFGLLIGQWSTIDDNQQIIESIPLAHHEFYGTASATALTMAERYVDRKRKEEGNVLLSLIGAYWYPTNDCITANAKDNLDHLNLRSILQPIAQHNEGKAVLLRGYLKNKKPCFEGTIWSASLAKSNLTWHSVSLSDAACKSATRMINNGQFEEIQDIEHLLVN